jgi:steroid 5-alpha reductase family enzyme
VAAGYLLALIAAAWTLALLEAHPLVEIFLADLVATAVIYLCSLLTRNASFYDAYWSVAPPAIALGLLSYGGEGVLLRQLLLGLVVGLWAVRLTLNWAWTWQGFRHEDWRYVQLAERSGRLWWLLSLLGIHLFPTLVVFAGCLPLLPALLSGAAPIGWLDWLAFGIGLAAVWLEYEADRQLHAHRARRASRSEVLDSGVWRLCRHPNYVGEIGFWVSLFLFGIAAWGGVAPWTWLGPVAMVGLFTIVSIPMIETRLLADKPGYAAYRARTPALLPLPWPRWR